jgi:hypothetical protein
MTPAAPTTENNARSSKSMRKKRRPADAKTSKSAPATPLFDEQEMIIDLCRYSEGILTEQQVRKKYRLPDDIWTKMAEDESLCERIEAERVRRVRSGDCKRELAQKHVVRGPAVLAGIMDDPSTHAKHKIDSIRALDHLAANGPQAAGDGSMFNIVINLGADADGREIVETYNKPIKIGVSDDNTIIDNIGE